MTLAISSALRGLRRTWVGAALLVVALYALLPLPSAWPQVPLTIGYQGYLTDAAGQPINTSVALTLRLYDAASGGKLLWQEVQPGVTVSKGVFQVLLGSVTPLDERLFAAQRYLGLQAGGDPEMTPRQALASSPYAIWARNAVSADAAALVSGPVSGSQITGTISGATLSGGTLTSLDGRYTQAPNVAAPQATTLSTVQPGGAYASIALAPDGFPIIAHVASAPQRLIVVKCANPACSATSSSAVIETGNVGTGSIAIGANGLPVISYARYTTTMELIVVGCGNAQCNSGNTFSTLDNGSSGNYLWTSLAIGADGLPVISFVYHGGSFRIAKCGNAQCSAGNLLTTIDGPVPAYSSIAVAFDGLPVVSYGMSGLKVLKCGNPACSAGNTITLVEPGNAVGSYSSLAIGSDGLPVISYADGLNNLLRVAKCANASCSSGTALTTVDSGHAYYETSITVGLDGLPVISYQRANGGDLKVAHCGNLGCTAGNAIVTLDSAANVTDFTSITIGTDGGPVIAYRDQDTISLKVAKCANAVCAPYFRRR